MLILTIYINDPKLKDILLDQLSDSNIPFMTVI